MPELPDIDVYVDALRRKLGGQVLCEARLGSPFLLRTVSPTLADAEGQAMVAVRRVGKRVAFGMENDLWLVLHLMIAGRLHWHEKPPGLTARNRVAAFDFDTGSLLLTEAGSKKRASLWVVAGDAGLAAQDPGGIEPLAASFEAFRAAFTRENHTLKRALCDPHILSGIGNAYSDEILHAARLSPVSLSQSLDEAALRRLYGAMREVLIHWRSRLLAGAAGELPSRVTAFHPDMAVHGRFRKPCRVCGSPVQRIRYKSTETNYCANCQTGSRLLRDRALSRLLKADWPAALPPV
jgi:formamidopyrimidine-DNA glycosylase